MTSTELPNVTLPRRRLLAFTAVGGLSAALWSIRLPPTWPPVLTAPTGYVKPTGAGYQPFEKLAQRGSITATAATLSPNASLTFAAGTFSCKDFAVAQTYGVMFTQNVTGIYGSGSTKTVFQMTPGTSTQAKSIPAQKSGGTNQLCLMRVGDGWSNAPSSRPYQVAGFTLLGTTQPVDPKTGKPQTYNGLRLYSCKGVKVYDVLVKGIPGNSDVNPGETFSVCDYRSVNTTMQNVEVDGRNSAGVAVAGSGMGFNFTNGLTSTNCFSHDTAYGHGITHYQCTGAITHTDFASTNTGIPINFEQCVATVNLVRFSAQANRAVTSAGDKKPGTPVFAVIDSSLGSSKVTITDPTMNGLTPTPSNPLVVVVHKTYNGATQLQKTSDIRLVLSGKVRPDCLRFATNENIPYA